MDNKLIISNAVNWLFGTAVLATGLINAFWGNDAGFGIFLILLSLAFFPPANALLKYVTGFSIPSVVKILLGIFIIWAALGVGELPDKISLMLEDIQS